MRVQKISKPDPPSVPRLNTSASEQDTTPCESSVGSSDESDDNEWDSGEDNAKMPLVRQQ